MSKFHILHCELTLVAYFYIFSILQNIATSSKCLVTRELHDHWIWYVTVLWWHHNILEYWKYTEICHQCATHSYLIVKLLLMDLSQWHVLFYLKTLVRNGLLFSAQSNIFKPIFAQCEVNACVSGGMSYECVDKSSWSLSRPGEMHREDVKGVASIALATPFFICICVYKYKNI